MFDNLKNRYAKRQMRMVLESETTRQELKEKLQEYICVLKEIENDAMSETLRKALMVARKLDMEQPENQTVIEALRTHGAKQGALAAFVLISTVGELEEEGRDDAVLPLIPWMHTLVSYNYPDTRAEVVEMWDHLRRGVPYLTDDRPSRPADTLLRYLDWAIE